MKDKLDIAKQNTFYISGLGIEVMGEDVGKGSYATALQFVEAGSLEGWRLPNADECFALWSIKQFGCGNIKDSYYWTGEERIVHSYAPGSMGFMFKMDKPFLGTRSKKDFYYIRLVRSI